MSKHKTNYDKLQTITVFAAALSVRGLAAVVNSDGEAEAAGAGVMPDVIFTEGGVPASEATQGAMPNGGIIPVIAGAAVVAGALVATNAAGKFITATSGAVACGRAVNAAGAADDFFAIQFTNKGAVA